ncbi:MAG: type VI secretion system tip protein VgrG [Polyangiaceae bacterium]|nr:type VI secretion system tip protein VgrG [Polyangiaceae bacterium]
MSNLYRYEITAIVREPAPDIDPDELVQMRATLRIATLTEPAYRVIHGIIVEAEELGPVPGGTLIRLVLMPPWTRAMHRRRCRIFLEKTTRQIIEDVLQGDPSLQLEAGATVSPDSGNDASFTPAKEVFTWRESESSRIDDVATRPYCVQYNESDFAFVSRLLEEEGISYHFENGDGACLLVFSDKDSGRARLEPYDALGPGISGRSLSSMKLGARLRPKKVSMVDYNWKQPALDMSVAAPGRPAAEDLVDHEYPGRYLESPDMGKPLANAKLERLEVEARYAVGEGTCRILSAGNLFALENVPSRHEGEYLATKIEVRGEQPGVLPPNVVGSLPLTGVPYFVTAECARCGKDKGESRYRPPRSTQKPRIQGSQTAFVTDEPNSRGAEIHVGGPPGAEIGCVRVKFHWDQDTDRHNSEPTSCWVRVSQVFAGVGEGAVFHPRVGVEVIVDYEEGDPDRPIVVGRVYNGKNRPPAGAPTVSTFKTMSSPATGEFNEFTFDDTAGTERIKLHTPYNWNSDCGNDRTESVGNNSSSTVAVDRNESTGSNRSTMVGSDNSEVIGANESVTVGSNQSTVVGSNQSTTVGVDRSVEVGANQSTTVGANQSITVGGNRSTTISGDRSETIGGNASQTIGASKEVAVGGSSAETVGADQSVTVGGKSTHTISGDVALSANAQATASVGANLAVDVGADGAVQTGGKLEMIAGGDGAFQAANISVNAAGEIVLAAGGSSIKISGAGVEINGAMVKAAGASVEITGGIVKIN